MILCPMCGSENDDDDDCCDQCGDPLKGRAMVDNGPAAPAAAAAGCPVCGNTDIKAGYKTCPRCGAVLTAPPGPGA